MCAAMEPFTTTYGFTSTRGFDAPPAISTAASCGASAFSKSALSASPSMQGGQFSVSEARQGAARALGLPRAVPPVLAPSPASVVEPHTQDSAQSVGWKGLFEISRMSGAPGIVGVSATQQNSQSGTQADSQIEVCATAHTNQSIRRLVKSVVRGLKACQEPEKALDGMGGTYFFCNENGQKVAILKPCDEEPLAPNNPKGYVGRALGDPGWKPTVRVGEAAMREVAAYLLDGGFAHVPTSVLVRARHPIFCYNSHVASVRASTSDLFALSRTSQGGDAGGAGGPVVGASLPMKLGSLQEFVPHECDTSEMGPSRFLARDVHRIGILDIRLFNTDRHAGNMLVRQADASSGGPLSTQYELIPIDHGFCLPETLEAPYFEWLHWPQAMLPFGPEELQYIRNLDIEADKELLSKELPNLRPECVRVLELTTALLQRCAEAGMTLYEIATVVSRPFVDADEDPSELEKVCDKAKRCFEMQEIAEGDEDSSECEGSEACDEDEGQGECNGEGDDGSADLLLQGLDDMYCGDADPVSISATSVGGMLSGSMGMAGSGTRGAGALSSACAAAAAAAAGTGAGAALAGKLAQRSGGLAVGMVGSGGGAAGRGRQLLGCNSNSTEEEGMMFDLEEDAAGNRAVVVKTVSSATFEPESPCSIGSELWPGDASSAAGRSSVQAGSSAAIAMSGYAGRAAAAAAAGGGAVGGFIAAAAAAAGGADAAKNMARSIHVPNSFLWCISSRRRQGTKRLSKCSKPNSPQAYPPPVLANTQGVSSISFSEFDERGWYLFKREVLAMIDDAICSGRWRQASRDTHGGVAASCPRF